MKLKNISIRNALVSFTVIVALLFAIVGLISYLTVGSFSNTLREAAANTTLLRNSGKVLQMQEAVRSDVLAYIVAYERSDLDWLERIRKDHTNHSKSLKIAIAEIEKSNMSRDLRSAFDAARALALSFVKDSEDLIALTTSDVTTVMGRMSAYDAKFIAVTVKLDALVLAIEAENRSYEASASTGVVTAVALVSTAVLIGLAILGMIAWWLFLHITRPIEQVVKATEDLRAGQGDLTRKLPAMGGEFGKLSTSMNGFVGQLHDLIAQVAINAGEIATAARQISAGNTDLSARTEEQASTLEETASSMEEFTSSEDRMRKTPSSQAGWRSPHRMPLRKAERSLHRQLPR